MEILQEVEDGNLAKRPSTPASLSHCSISILVTLHGDGYNPPLTLV